MPEIQEISGKISTSVKPPHLPGTWHLAPDLRHLPPLSSFNSDPLIPSLSLSPPASCPHPPPNRLLRPSVPGTSRGHCVQGGENKQVDTSRRPFPPSAALPPSLLNASLTSTAGGSSPCTHRFLSLQSRRSEVTDLCSRTDSGIFPLLVSGFPDIPDSKWHTVTKQEAHQDR